MTSKTTKTLLLTTTMLAFAFTISTSIAFADHTSNTSTWQTDMTFDITSSLNNISHASFTPATDFVNSADVWNDVSSNWWDFTRDDSNGDIDIGSHSFGWFSTTLAETSYITSGGTMSYADVEFNTEIDFRDVNVSQGWWSYDYETVAVHEIGHVAGIHDHTTTSSSPMKATLSANTVDRTLNSHDESTIGGMY